MGNIDTAMQYMLTLTEDFTIKEAASGCGIAYGTVNDAIQRMKTRRKLFFVTIKEVSKGRYNKYYNTTYRPYEPYSKKTPPVVEVERPLIEISYYSPLDTFIRRPLDVLCNQNNHA